MARKTTIELESLSLTALRNLVATSSGSTYKAVRAELSRRTRLAGDDAAVSPVVGTLLMLAVVVMLAGLVWAGVAGYAAAIPPAPDYGADGSTTTTSDPSTPPPPTKYSVEPLPGHDCQPSRMIADYKCTKNPEPAPDGTCPLGFLKIGALCEKLAVA